jgi:hypothetical protein
LLEGRLVDIINMRDKIYGELQEVLRRLFNLAAYIYL